MLIPNHLKDPSIDGCLTQNIRYLCDLTAFVMASTDVAVKILRGHDYQKDLADSNSASVVGEEGSDELKHTCLTHCKSNRDRHVGCPQETTMFSAIINFPPEDMRNHQVLDLSAPWSVTSPDMSLLRWMALQNGEDD